MKLLRDEEIVVEEGVVKITMKPVTTSVQAAIFAFEVGGLGLSKVIERTKYMLRSVIEKVEVQGIEYATESLASRADLADSETRDVFSLIGNMVMTEILIGAETKKKLEEPPKSGSSDGDVANVQNPSTEGSQREVADRPTQ